MKKILLSLLLIVGIVYAESNTTEPQFKVKINKPVSKKPASNKPMMDIAYNMPIDMNSKFLCEATLGNGKTVYFISVKAMMMVYNHQDYFKKNKLLEDDIAQIYIHDYLSGDKLEAQKAVYVFGSRLIGPHGDDLIPLISEDKAKLFELKYGGHKILPFEKLDKGLIRYLDM
jgi:nitrous oxide reductase accessory protein NosL